MPRFECEECGATRTYSIDQVGRRVKCPTCGAAAKLPDGGDTANAGGCSSATKTSRGPKKNAAAEADTEPEYEEEEFSLPRRSRASSRSRSRKKRSRNSQGLESVTSVLRWIYNLDRLQLELYSSLTLLFLGTASFFFGSPETASYFFLFNLMACIGAIFGSVFWMWLEVFHVNKGLWLLGLFLGPFPGLQTIYCLFALTTYYDDLKRPFHQHLLGIVLFILQVLVWFVLGMNFSGWNAQPIKPIVITSPESQPKVTPKAAETTTPIPSPPIGSPATKSEPALFQSAKTSVEQRQTDVSRGFSLIPPPGWTVTMVAGPSIISFVGPVSQGSQIAASFGTEIFPGSLEAWSEKKLADNKKQAPKLRVVSKSAFQPAEGSPGIKLILDVDTNRQVTLRFSLYLFEQQHRKINMIVGVPLQVVGEFSDILDATARSMRFEAIPDVEPPVPAVSSAQPPAAPVASGHKLQVVIKVQGYTGTGDILRAAKEAVRSVPQIVLQDVQFDAATSTLTMEALPPVSTQPIKEALIKAGLQVDQVQVRGFRKN